MRAASIVAACLLAGPAAAQESATQVSQALVIQAPSGLALMLQDVVWEPDSRIVRLRFVAESLGGPQAMPFSAVAGDFPWLCERYGVPALRPNELEASQIVIAIADRAVPFGTLDPEAVQFFEGFSIDAAGACVWEPY